MAVRSGHGGDGFDDSSMNAGKKQTWPWCDDGLGLRLDDPKVLAIIIANDANEEVDAVSCGAGQAF